MILQDIIKEYASATPKVTNLSLRRFLSTKEGLEGEYSRSYISKILTKLTSEGFLYKRGSHNDIWYTTDPNFKDPSVTISKTYIAKRISDDEALWDVLDDPTFQEDLRENVKSIFSYAFTEMINNAISHSKSEKIQVNVEVDYEKVSFEVIDYGVGIFNNIMRKKKLKDEFEAIQDLLKGKVTTDPNHHTGEGIFFTSKVADKLVFSSYNFQLVFDNKIKDVFVVPNEEPNKGTTVQFQIDKSSDKHLKDFFEEYTSNPEFPSFDKTEIKVELYTYSDIFISRSQARRVMHELDKFKKIVLDFENVTTIGQAFADEVFRVFQKRHPEIEINAINTNSAIDFMIKRAILTAQK